MLLQVARSGPQVYHRPGRTFVPAQGLRRRRCKLAAFVAEQQEAFVQPAPRALQLVLQTVLAPQQAALKWQAPPRTEQVLKFLLLALREGAPAQQEL